MNSALDFVARVRSWTSRQEADFFAVIRLRNGTFKTTADRRMDDLNGFVIEQWKRSGFRPNEVLDLAASSGITSVEWLEALTRAGFAIQMTATDLSLRAKIVQRRRGIYVLVDETGHVLQHIFFGVPVRPWRRRLDYFTGYAIVSWLAEFLNSDRTRGTNGFADAREITMVSHRALGRSDLHWRQDDILAPNDDDLVARFDAVRAANILNRDYFSAQQLQLAVRNLKQRLRGPGAALLVNRTWNDGSNHATLFRIDGGNRFEVQAKFGQGSEIEDVVLAT